MPAAASTNYFESSRACEFLRIEGGLVEPATGLLSALVWSDLPKSTLDLTPSFTSSFRSVSLKSISTLAILTATPLLSRTSTVYVLINFSLSSRYFLFVCSDICTASGSDLLCCSFAGFSFFRMTSYRRDSLIRLDLKILWKGHFIAKNSRIPMT